MSTQRNRIQVLLPDDVYQAIATIARLSDTSMSGFVAQILKAEKDTLIQVSHMLMEAREAQDKLKLSSKLMIDQLTMKAHAHRREIDKTLDSVHALVSDANSSAAEGDGGATRGRPRPRNPLAINKGVKNGGTEGVGPDYRPAMPSGWKDV